MASFAGTSRRMVIALEKKVSQKDTEILSLKDSVKSAKEKLHQSSEQEVLSSSKLNVVEAKIAELEIKLQKEVKEKAKRIFYQGSSDEIGAVYLAEKNAEEVKELTA